jgi:2-polyprenyl-3-methyl-5-hydroxy-6-metoxy-1,4-benzoquinol methylase
MHALPRQLKEGERDAAHKTAITRRKPSAPVLWLERHGLLKGRMLDYGAGRGFDADYLGASKFDPHWWPEKPEGKYDTVICNYVLNVVEPGDEAGILADIRGYLAPGGHAYLAVRRDVEKEGFTKRGTYRRTVVLDLPPVFEAPGKFAIYELA